MRVLGIDPGATTGWCVYDSEARRVVEAGEFCDADGDVLDPLWLSDRYVELVAIERPRGLGPTRPQLVECGIVFGRLWERALHVRRCDVVALHRLEVCKRLTVALHKTVHVHSDATAWAVLIELHGGAAAGAKPRTKKGEIVEPGGPLGLVTGHARAALAVAYASLLPASEPVMATNGRSA